MNIMFEDSITDEVRSKYTLLPLDTFYFVDPGVASTAYCLIENTPLEEMALLTNFFDLHNNLMKNYYLRNWKYCEDAIEHLQGKWNGEVDTFYNSILERVKVFKAADLPEDWNGYIVKS